MSMESVPDRRCGNGVTSHRPCQYWCRGAIYNPAGVGERFIIPRCLRVRQWFNESNGEVLVAPDLDFLIANIGRAPIAASDQCQLTWGGDLDALHAKNRLEIHIKRERGVVRDNRQQVRGVRSYAFMNGAALSRSR